ncbi:MAG: NAD(P)/FAD-dependent oxidoreductase [Solirubrobacterales bacterium]|nr:NAD(P)/FAD-dependent oxidoreductase [Solirubrobacterales bacterium]
MHAEAEAHLREAVAIANIPTLLPVLVQLTGETRWLEGAYRPERNRGLDDNTTGGLPEEVQEEIRAAALAALVAWRDGKPPAMPEPPPELLVRMLGVAMGEEVPPEYGPMIDAELRHAGIAPDEPEPRVPVPRGFSVLVIGAGVSGIAAAIRLQDAGIPYTVLERNDRVGGTWLENRYPGAGVDTPSALYSFSFARHDWSKYFALRDELHGYLEGVAADHDVTPNIHFETEVVSAIYDEDAQGWTVTGRRADGSTETHRANVVISAVGGFTRPKMPTIAGLESFAGPCVHTARWPEDLDLAGKRVAVIGNGASAMQLVPAIAEDVESVTVFQRSPQWAAPFELFHADVPEPLRWLAKTVPLYRVWYRLRAGWTFNDRIHPTLQKDPDWPHPERAVNAVNDAHRRFFTRYIEAELGDRPDLMEKVLPDYPPYGKRILLDNGWYRTLTRENVHLVTEPIAAVRADRIVTSSGAEHDIDVLVCATGFDVVRFLAPMEIRGRSGRTLRETWDDDDARAYLGLTVPDFPNLFTIYGPNTQAGHGGSLIGTAEAQVHYVLDLIRQMLARGLGAVECRPEVYDDYGRRVDEAHEKMIWTHHGMETYYRNSRGRVVVNTPWRVVDYWHMSRRADLDDYRVEPAVAMAEAV